MKATDLAASLRAVAAVIADAHGNAEPVLRLAANLETLGTKTLAAMTKKLLGARAGEPIAASSSADGRMLRRVQAVLLPLNAKAAQEVGAFAEALDRLGGGWDQVQAALLPARRTSRARPKPVAEPIRQDVVDSLVAALRAAHRDDAQFSSIERRLAAGEGVRPAEVMAIAADLAGAKVRTPAGALKAIAKLHNQVRLSIMKSRATAGRTAA